MPIYWCKCGKQVGPETTVCPNCHARLMGIQESTLEQFHKDQKKYIKAKRHRRYRFIYNFIDDHLLMVLILFMIALFVAIFSLGTLSVYLGFNTLGTILRIIGVVVIALPTLIGIVLGNHIIKEKYEEEIRKERRETNEIEEIRSKLREFDTYYLNRMLEERNQTENEFIKEILYRKRKEERERDILDSSSLRNRGGGVGIPPLYHNPYLQLYNNITTQYDKYQPRWCPDIIWFLFTWILYNVEHR